MRGAHEAPGIQQARDIKEKWRIEVKSGSKREKSERKVKKLKYSRKLRD